MMTRRCARSPADCAGCGSGLSTCFFPWEQQGAPWDWWNNDVSDPISYPNIALTNPLAPEGLTADIYACQSTVGNPDMSEDKGLAFASMIQEFICPRIYAALDLGNASNVCSIKESQLHKELINVVDVTGRSVHPQSENMITLHIYDDGSVEKKYLIK